MDYGRTKKKLYTEQFSLLGVQLLYDFPFIS